MISAGKKTPGYVIGFAVPIRVYGFGARGGGVTGDCETSDRGDSGSSGVSSESGSESLSLESSPEPPSSSSVTAKSVFHHGDRVLERSGKVIVERRGAL